LRAFRASSVIPEMNSLDKFKFLFTLLLASTPLVLTKLRSTSSKWLWLRRLRQFAGIRSFLSSEQPKASLLQEPRERLELSDRFKATVPSWQRLVEVDARFSTADWKAALLCLDRYEQLYDHICFHRKGRSEDKGWPASSQKTQLLARISVYLDYRSPLQVEHLERETMGRLRSLYVKTTSYKGTAAAKPRSSVTPEDLWKYVRLSEHDARKPNYLLFEVRALSLRYSLDVEVLAYVAIFGVFLWEFSKRAPRRPLKEECFEEEDEEIACLFWESWKDALNTGETELKPFFSELAALQMGLSVKPKCS